MHRAIIAMLAATVSWPGAAMPAAGLTAQAAAESVAPVSSVPVLLAPVVHGSQSGRLIVFAKRVEPGAKPEDEIDTSPFEPTGTAIAASDAWSWSPGQVALVDAGTDAFPAAFATLPPGTYRFQAVLDRNDDYNYGGRGAGDLVSAVVEEALPGPMPLLTVATEVPGTTDAQRLMRGPEGERAAMRAALAQVRSVDFVSPAMTRFRGRPTGIHGWVALPPGYGTPGTTFPTVFSTGGFGSSLASAKFSAASAMVKMAAGTRPPMIWVFLDQSTPTGTHEFADSVNNGPWGQAVTAEFIPWIEGKYAMDARPGSRFLTGHSSGGWAVLWLQVRYPKVFGGSWPTSPDPSDFHDFTNIDLYAANANAYHDAAGKPLPLVRDKGKVIATLEQFARIERTLGPVGGQLASFDWVFSPKGADGRPMPMFDRATGAVDPVVAAYWTEHYDIARLVAREWPTLKPDLDGKIHLIVGTADTFYLDGPAHRLQAVFDKLGAHESFTFVPGRTHFDLFVQGNDRSGMMNDISWEMYHLARPATTLQRKAG
ncbi:MAG: alpha/beta hydrolase-fold protein [Janthinobacterium lividum]